MYVNLVWLGLFRGHIWFYTFYRSYSFSVCEYVLCGQMQVLSLLGLNGAGADARHLQSVTQQLSQATSEIQSLTNQLQSSQSEVVSCDWTLILVTAFIHPSFIVPKQQIKS